MNSADVESWLADREAPSSRASARLASGTVIDGWKVVAFLGAGISAEVYRVVNTRMGGDAALKLLVDGSRGLAARFRLEIEVVRTLALSAMPRYFGSGEHEGRPYLIMEYLQPLELPFAEPRAAADFAAALARGVQELHEAGFLHRDLKPSNVLVRRNGAPVIVDLGLVKRISSRPDGTVAASDLSVVDGHPVGVGTPGFAAPEQLIQGEAGVRSDVFALGKLLRAACGEKIPSRLMRVIRIATSDDPRDRYPTADAFADEVTRAARPLFGPRRSFALGLFAGLAALTLGYLLWPAPSFDPQSPNPTILQSSNPKIPTPLPPLSRQPGETEAARFLRILPRAAAGELEAEVAVAEAYFHGQGTETNREESVRWYSKAAAAGSSGAQASLGLCKLRGWGCERDPEAAAAWFLKAANEGHLGAMNDLAFCFLNGCGVDRDEQEGFNWAMKAAERGHPAAEMTVGECYLDGRGVEPNPARADTWLQRAARQGNARAQMLLRTR